MDIESAKRQVKDTIEAYMAVDESGERLLPAERQRPIFLVGAPGIGKTAIVSQIAAELDLGLVSYSMTHHTRQSALGLPLIVHKNYRGIEYDASEYTMSEIIASVYDCIEKSGFDEGILFLDEINCVSETLYPSMLQFLQFKTFGRHRIPDGWVVVTAGNPPEYNRSVHDFDVVTLDRLKRIAVEPDYNAWRRYAVDKGVHPAVVTFLDAKKNCFYAMESTLEGKSFATARGWDDLSDMIGIFERLEKNVDKELVCQYIQNERIAGEFAAYYDLFNKYSDDYRIGDILQGCIGEDVVERAKAAEFDERLSVLGLILDSLTDEQKGIVEKTDILVAVRDELRQVKERAGEGREPVVDLLAEAEGRSEKKLDMLVASGAASKQKRTVLKGQRAMLAEIRKSVEDGLRDSTADGVALMVAAYADRSSMDEPVALAEAHMAHSFEFVMRAFGDAQEMLVFTTELTQRVSSARYIAQYGSESYYAHNANMIMSDHQRELMRRVEALDEV